MDKPDPAASRAAGQQRHAVDVLDLGQQQPLDHSRPRRGLRRIIPQVLQLARIGLEVVELAPPGAVEHAEPVTTAHQRMHPPRQIRARSGARGRPPIASSMQAIMPQVSACASCASRADTLMLFMPLRLALPVSRSAMMLRTSGGGSQSLRLNASGIANCSGLYISQYLPGGLNGWCGSGNDTMRKNGRSASVSRRKACARSPMNAVG